MRIGISHLFYNDLSIFGLLAATNGDAKNFSLLIDAEGAYRLTPFYNILSMYPAIGGQWLNIRDAKLAMGLNATKGKKYAVEKIFSKHFIQIEKVVRLILTSRPRYCEKLLIRWVA